MSLLTHIAENHLTIRIISAAIVGIAGGVISFGYPNQAQCGLTKLLGMQKPAFWFVALAAGLTVGATPLLIELFTDR